MNLLYSKICSDGPDELAVQYNIWGCSPKMEGRLIALFSHVAIGSGIYPAWPHSQCNEMHSFVTPQNICCLPYLILRDFGQYPVS